MDGKQSGLVEFAPFLSNEKLLELLQKFPFIDSMIDELVAGAFLEEDDLENLLETIPEEQILSSQIVGLAPFKQRKGRRLIEAGNEPGEDLALHDADAFCA